MKRIMKRIYIFMGCYEKSRDAKMELDRAHQDFFAPRSVYSARDQRVFGPRRSRGPKTAGRGPNTLIEVQNNPDEQGLIPIFASRGFE